MINTAGEREEERKKETGTGLHRWMQVIQHLGVVIQLKVGILHLLSLSLTVSQEAGQTKQLIFSSCLLLGWLTPCMLTLSALCFPLLRKSCWLA